MKQQTPRKKTKNVFPVRTDDFESRIQDACDLRNDDLAAEVRGRLESVSDLFAADAVYHQACSVNFRTCKNIPVFRSPISQDSKPDNKRKASFARRRLLQNRPISENSFHGTSGNASFTTSSTYYTASTRSRSTNASQLRFSISGFCSSYYEVQKFESSAAAVQRVDLPGDVSNIFVQFVADNVDHNTRIIDGLNTFHGMGIIAGITPGTKRTQPIPRIAFSSDEIKALAKIEIKYYKPQTDLMA
ncbi:unnamed protein product [Mytilus coruscus]|uniref:Uncharacterized protein n=1 Tax=Mytilus coruscus TaxID=42192 RepID=A0A6J8CRK6_MYTCO|nr:unnamed protein product [Mytilus coruscus]